MSGRVKSAIKAVAHRLVSEYRINWIYASRPTGHAREDDPDVKPETAADRVSLANSTTRKVRNSQAFAVAGYFGMVLSDGDQPVVVAHFARPDQYDRSSTWPLRAGEVCLISIATEERARGQGLAPRLIRAATARYLSRGCNRIIAFIWWNNRPSLRAFAKAGWNRIGFSIELRIGTRWLALRIPLL